MSDHVRSLDRITIPERCNADWESMIGNDQVRFCEHCNLHVTNLSNFTRREALRLVEHLRAAGRRHQPIDQRQDADRQPHAGDAMEDREDGGELPPIDL